MEKARRSSSSEDQQIYNKLLFDALNEAIFTSPTPPTPLSVTKMVSKWASVGQQGDDVVSLITQEQRDVSLWNNCDAEREEVIREVVEWLFDQLLADTVDSFLTKDL